jgi:hypothetical protein
MRLGLLIANGLVLCVIGWMVTFGSTEERAAELLPQRMLAGVQPAKLQQLESQAAMAPTAGTVAALAGAYLDRNQSGLATAVLEKAPREMRERPEVAHLYARALFHRGRAREALAVARDASQTCAEGGTCAPWLVAKTTRQVAFFEQLVSAGIDDPQANPDATLAAYDRSTHAVRLVAMR